MSYTFTSQVKNRDNNEDFLDIHFKDRVDELFKQTKNILMVGWRHDSDKTFVDYLVSQNKEVTIVEIYEKSGKYFGKITQLYDVASQNKKCDKCEGENKNKPIIGLVIIKNMIKDGVVFSGGTITDPSNGKVYSCKFENIKNDKITVRGFIGFSLFGRSQTWIRL